MEIGAGGWLTMQLRDTGFEVTVRKMGVSQARRA
jgi:hypothetical protein